MNSYFYFIGQLLNYRFWFFREGSVASTYRSSNPLLEAENNKNIIIRDVAGFFGRQDSSCAAQILFDGGDTKDNEEESSSPEDGMDALDKQEQTYMSPIVSFNLTKFWISYIELIIQIIIKLEEEVNDF